jgi:spore coat protein A
MFDTAGRWLFPDIGINPEHPFWLPEFLGDTIVVNGKTWPYLSVEPRRYRFRFLNGSNARVYRMWLEDMVNALPGPAFWQIGSDGGLLDTPVKLDPADPNLPRFFLLAPGERADIIIDFAGFAGQTLTLRNNARAPFPKGATASPQTVGQVMQFRVGTVISAGSDPSYNPATLQSPRQSPIVPINAGAPAVKRQLTLNEVMAVGGPLEVLVNNTKWAGTRPDGTPIPGFVPDPQGNYLSELPKLGTTEVWEVINLTADAHPIHLHLVQFQLLSRQNFNTNKYNRAYNKAFAAGAFAPAFGPPLDYFTANADGALGGNPAIGPHLQGPAAPPEPNEVGWKDTVVMYPGQVTRIAVRFTAQDGAPFPFDATSGPGYVWHCHIVDHEDNEMMRPYNPVP